MNPKTRDCLSVITQSPILGKLTLDEQKVIAQTGKFVEFNKDQFLAKEGTPAHVFYLIDKGHLAVEVHTKSGNITLQTLGHGEIVGWSWLFEPYLWTFDVKALEKSSVIVFDGRLLISKFEVDSKLGFNFIKNFSKIISMRLQQTRMRLIDMYSGGQ